MTERISYAAGVINSVARTLSVASNESTSVLSSSVNSTLFSIAERCATKDEYADFAWFMEFMQDVFHDFIWFAVLSLSAVDKRLIWV